MPAPQPDRDVPDRLTFVGHATVMVEMAGVRLLTDPILRDRILHIRRHSSPVAPEVVAGLDAVLLSHLHADHFDTPSLRRLPPGTPIVAPAGARRQLQRRGFTEVIELVPGESTSIGGVRVAAVAVTHDGRRYPVGSPIQALGYDIQATARVFFAGDTAAGFDTSELTSGIDVALLPIAGWGPRLNPIHHLDSGGAAAMAAEILPRVAVPIHWGTLLRAGLGHRADEILERPAREFAARMAELAPEVEARILRPGDSMPLAAADPSGRRSD